MMLVSAVDDWRFVSTEHGERSVGVSLDSLMPLWHVDNWRDSILKASLYMYRYVYNVYMFQTKNKIYASV